MRLGWWFFRMFMIYSFFLITGKQRHFINNAKRIAEGIAAIKTPFSPRLGDDLLIKVLTNGLLRPFENDLWIIYREIHVFLIGTGIKSISIGLRIETSQNNPAAIEVMPSRRYTFSLHIEQGAIELSCPVNIRYRQYNTM